MARWKASGLLAISANWTSFTSFHGWGTMSGYCAKSLCSIGGVTLSTNFRGNDCWRQKTRVRTWAITWRCLRDPTFSRFDTKYCRVDSAARHISDVLRCLIYRRHINYSRNDKFTVRLIIIYCSRRQKMTSSSGVLSLTLPTRWLISVVLEMRSIN